MLYLCKDILFGNEFVLSKRPAQALQSRVEVVAPLIGVVPPVVKYYKENFEPVYMTKTAAKFLSPNTKLEEIPHLDKEQSLSKVSKPSAIIITTRGLFLTNMLCLIGLLNPTLNAASMAILGPAAVFTTAVIVLSHFALFHDSCHDKVLIQYGKISPKLKGHALNRFEELHRDFQLKVKVLPQWEVAAWCEETKEFLTPFEAEFLNIDRQFYDPRVYNLRNLVRHYFGV